MAWNVEFTRTAEKQLKKLDVKWQCTIFDFLENEIATLPDQKKHRNELVGDKAGFWRYRFGDYRVICDVREEQFVIREVTIVHRKEGYGLSASLTPATIFDTAKPVQVNRVIRPIIS